MKRSSSFSHHSVKNQTADELLRVKALTGPFPAQQFLMRSALPMVAVFLFLIAGVQGVQEDPRLQPSRDSQILIPALENPNLSLFVRAQLISERFPDFCYPNQAVNDLQSQQCGHLLQDAIRLGGLALLPLFGALLFLGFAEMHFHSLYRRIYQKIREGKVDLIGKALPSERNVQDVASWLYLLKPIYLELSSETPERRKQKVYLLYHATIPHVGDQVICYRLRNLLGKDRYIAFIYTPHVAVVRGSSP